MLQRPALELALACLPFCASCCPDLAPKPTATPLQYPSGLSDDDEGAIRWEVKRSSCAMDGTTPNSGALSIIFAGPSSPSPSGIDCELHTTLALPPNTYLRSLSIQARGALMVEPKERLSSMLTVRRGCDDGAPLIEVSRTHDWAAPREPGAEPDGALLLDLDIGGTALMTAAGESMCDGRGHVMELVTSVQVTDQANHGSATGLDSMDLHADVADCFGPRFESLCEWAENAYPNVASTDEVEPPTLEVADTLAYGLTPGSIEASDPSCRDDVDVVRRAAGQRLESRRDALSPLLHQRCSEPLADTGRDMEKMAAVEERRCRARQAMAFLGASTQGCECRSGGSDASVAPYEVPPPARAR